METINREASEKTKGFRLQKLRAVQFMLEEVNLKSKSIFYTAIENIEDVSHTVLEDEGVKNYFEEDKNYQKTSKFTISSHAVKNSSISFR